MRLNYLSLLNELTTFREEEISVMEIRVLPTFHQLEKRHHTLAKYPHKSTNGKLQIEFLFGGIS